MKGWDRFTRAIIDFAQERIRPRMEQASRDSAGGSAERLATGPDLLFDKVFCGYTEVAGTFEVLQDVELYISRFPFGKSRVTRTRYLLFQFRAHLHEVYIFRERLIAYAKPIARLYAKTPRRDSASRVSDLAVRLVEATLSGLVSARGAHVHERRFSDERLDELQGTELIATHSDNPLYERVLRWQFHEARKWTRETVRTHNAALRKLLDLYADILYPVLFDADGKLVQPRRPEQLG